MAQQHALMPQTNIYIHRYIHIIHFIFHIYTGSAVRTDAANKVLGAGAAAGVPHRCRYATIKIRYRCMYTHTHTHTYTHTLLSKSDTGACIHTHTRIHTHTHTYTHTHTNTHTKPHARTHARTHTHTHTHEVTRTHIRYTL